MWCGAKRRTHVEDSDAALQTDASVAAPTVDAAALSFTAERALQFADSLSALFACKHCLASAEKSMSVSEVIVFYTSVGGKTVCSIGVGRRIVCNSSVKVSADTICVKGNASPRDRAEVSSIV